MMMFWQAGIILLAVHSRAIAVKKDNDLFEDEAFWGLRIRALEGSMSMPMPTDPPTPAMVELVADINPGRFSSFPSGFTEYKGYLYFNALDDGSTGIELWRTDGDETSLFADINPGEGFSNPGSGEFDDYFQELGGDLYFSAREETAGRELWKTDGTDTVLAFDIVPGPTGSDPAAGGYTELDGYLYFTTREIIDSKFNVWRNELWRMNGMKTEFVRNLRETFSVVELVAFDGFIYFMEFEEETAWGLWRTDGTDSYLVAAINPDGFARISSFTVFDGFLYFSATDRGSSGTTQLWRTDGDNTSLFADLNNPSAFTEFNGYLYFHADGPDFNQQLWRTDGVETELVTDTPFASIQPDSFAEFNGFLYFSAAESGTSSGLELWRTNGTETKLFADINPGSPSGQGSDPDGFTKLGDYLYFSANDGSHGEEVWRTNGADETSLVADINPGEDSSSPFQFTEFDGYLYFRANDGSNGVELWRLSG
jgi:ELWxxDGT repeat protein